MIDLFNLIDEYPPIQQPMRFGNKAFRSWHERLQAVSISHLFVIFNIQF